MHRPSKQKKQTGTRQPQKLPGRLRIIGGLWRSRLLSIIDAEGLRPTPDRVRETVFNWLTSYMAGSNCLDLFAGSGALGFEAASRGANSVTLIENNPQACDILKQNKQVLAADMLTINQQDALQFLKSTPRQFDIIFLDPPYQAGLLEPAINALQSGWIHNNTLIYIEAETGQIIPVPDSWNLLKDKTAGQVHYSLYQVGGA